MLIVTGDGFWGLCAILPVSDLCSMLRINDVRVSVGVIAWSREIVPCEQVGEASLAESESDK